MASPNQETKSGCFNSSCSIKNLLNKFWDKAIGVAQKTKKLKKDNQKRIIHALKVGLALTLVSLLYYYNKLYDGFGVNVIWAVLTVVVVFEFSVGATIGKGLNRMLATFVASALGIGCHRVAKLFGHNGEPILLAIFVYIIATVVTFARFFPKLKARYDYGLMIFILTFSLVSVSGYRDDQVLKMAHMRVSTIIIGSCASILICVAINPVWIGEDLHNLVLGNIEKLGAFLEAFGNEYFKDSEDVESNNDKLLLGEYKSVLNTKGNEENMANLAKWEPSHGKFKLCHPWQQYLKIGNLARECAYKIDALNSILHSKVKTPIHIRNEFEETSKEFCMECGKALKELASATKKMNISNATAEQIAKSKAEVEKAMSLLNSNKWEGVVLIDIVPVATVTLILLEIVEIIERIVEAIDELASKAHFKKITNVISPEQPLSFHHGIVQPIPCVRAKFHLVTIGE